VPIERPGGRSARREAGEAFILAILPDPLRVISPAPERSKK
jgi:hypothetical protein